VEIIISLLLIGVAVSSVMSAMLSTSLQSGRSQDQEQSALCLNQLLQELRNYVTADISPNPDAPGGGGASGWSLPEDTCGNNCWALAAGKHTIDVAQAPTACANATAISYLVTPVTLNNKNTISQVTAQITWNPQ
jgi:Tfp pilus assembly protein PilV